MAQILSATVKIRRDLLANWTASNPVPNQGEFCLEIDTDVIKIGDGITDYINLPEISGGGGSVVDNTVGEGSKDSFNGADLKRSVNSSTE